MNETKYTLEVEKWRDPEQASSSWSQNKCRIKNEDGETVFEYVRCYHSYSESTFAPFVRDGKNYALISSNYTRTDVVDLEKGEVIGQTPKENPFCPVQIYVPHAYQWEMNWGEDFKERFSDRVTSQYELKWDFDHPSEDSEEGQAFDRNGKPLGYTAMQFAFVAGCYWGDDSSWKIQLIDLRDLTKPNYYEAFGYLSMPSYVSKLTDLVEVDLWGDEKDPSQLFQVEVNGIHFRFNEDWSLKECYYEPPTPGKTPEQLFQERLDWLEGLKAKQEQS